MMRAGKLPLQHIFSGEILYFEAVPQIFFPAILQRHYVSTRIGKSKKFRLSLKSHGTGIRNGYVIIAAVIVIPSIVVIVNHKIKRCHRLHGIVERSYGDS